MQDFFEDGVLDGRAALVTGGGTGLGLEIARLLARLGAKVAIASRDPQHHHDFLADAEREGWRARAEVCDVRPCTSAGPTWRSFRYLVRKGTGG